MKRTLGTLLSVCVAAGCAVFAGEDYGARVDALLAGLGSENVGELNKAQDALFTMCAQASAPGADARAPACEAIASRLAKANPQARVWMLRQLERIGRTECVAAIVPLLTDQDEKVCDSARRALAGNASPEAAEAIAKALEKADKPLARIGLVNALNGHAGGSAAFTKALQKHLGSDDENLHRAATLALGRTGDKDAANALLGATTKGSPRAQTDAATGCFLLADTLCAKGDKAAALSIYKKLFARTGYVKSAALVGLGRAGGAGELDTIIAALGDPDAGVRGAAVEAAALVPPRDAVPALLAKLKGASKDATIGICRALGFLGDKAGATALIAASADADEEVRVAALRSLGTVGDASAVLPLLKAGAAGGNSAIAARESLDRIVGKDVDDALLAFLKETDAKVRAEAARSLGVRRMSSAVSSLLKTAEESEPAVRALIFKALSNVVKGEDLPALAAVVARTSDASDEAAGAILAAAAQIPDADQRADAVVAACGKATGPGKLALWTVLGRLGGPKALEVLRAGVKDPDEEARKAAIRALGLWPDTGAAEDLLALAKSAPDETMQVLALRGYVRLAGLAKERPAEAVKMLRTALETAKRPDEKKLALSGLGEVFDLTALKMIEPLLDDPTLKDEAAAAAVNVGAEIAKKHGDEVRAVMEKVVGAVKGGPTLQKAMATLGKLTTGTLDVRVANDPNAEKGVNYEYYEGDWDNLPDFDKLKPKKTGKAVSFDIGKRDQDDNFGFRFTGFLKITAKGTYAFSTASDDGSRLLIGGKVVVDNDGCHGVQEAMGKAELDAGMHPITVLFFEKGGGEELHVSGGKLK